MNEEMEGMPEPYIRIVEQPARSSVRFRYECEGRSAGPIPGINSSATCATYPTIQIMNYSGSRAMVVVSCVTVAQPYRQHPHHLVGRVGCHNGICTMIVDNSDHLCTFTHLGIQCAKRNEISQRLKLRKQLQIDPTFGGFDHISKSSRSLDLGAIRLCFQAFIEDPVTRKFTIALKPVVSDAVYDKKLLPKLIITDISTTSCPLNGGKVMLFCNYIDEEDIEVRFYETDSNGVVVWESIADLKPPIGEVHKRVGISLMAPSYPYPDSQTAVNVFLQLRRPSDQRSSDPIVFTYLPDCRFNNCPLLQYNRGNTSTQNMSTNTTQYNSAVTKRGRNKVNVYPKDNLNNDLINKKIKVLDVLNASDSEDTEEVEEGDEEMRAISPKIPVYHSPAVNHQYFGNNQYFCPNYVKPDVNNNNNLIRSQSVYNFGQNNSNPSNDLLMECLKTIDIDCLAAMQFQDYQHNYTEEDWTSLNQVFNYCNQSHDYNEINENSNHFQNANQSESQEKSSFIEL